ncbi:ribosomal protein L28e [Cunninghamella echinulata]|nr:ribosomal protein L28e [Cunninghamella echinulata]
MSSALVWELIKKNNSFIVKRDGVQFSKEPTNLTNVHSFKYSGIANEKAVGIQAAPRGVKVITKKAKKANSPAKAINSVVIAKTRRQTAKSVANLVARSKYRPDLLKAKKVRAAKGYRALKAQKAQ